MNKPQCSRCGETLHGNAETMPHLCADLVKRAARQEGHMAIIASIIEAHGGLRRGDERNVRQTVEAIYTNMASRLGS